MSDNIVERLDKRADILRRYYPGMHHTIKAVEAAADEIKRLRAEQDEIVDTLTFMDAEVERLRAALLEAADEVEDWGAYADTYFQEKWDLEGTVAKIKEQAGVKE